MNSQPWHFVVASSDADKARIGKAAAAGYPYNLPKILNASHVILFCTRVDAEGGHLERLLAQEQRDGRFKDDAARAGQAKGRQGYVNLHRYTLKDLPQWFEKQAYIALGNAMLAASTLGVDTTPMEGLDPAALDAELGLHEQGLAIIARRLRQVGRMRQPAQSGYLDTDRESVRPPPSLPAWEGGDLQRPPGCLPIAPCRC